MFACGRTQYCEVFVVSNGGSLDMGHYNGVYVLAEKIKKGPNRVNIEKIGDDLSGERLTDFGKVVCYRNWLFLFLLSKVCFEIVVAAQHRRVHLEA